MDDRQLFHILRRIYRGYKTPFESYWSLQSIQNIHFMKVYIYIYSSTEITTYFYGVLLTFRETVHLRRVSLYWYSLSQRDLRKWEALQLHTSSCPCPSNGRRVRVSANTFKAVPTCWSPAYDGPVQWSWQYTARFCNDSATTPKKDERRTLFRPHWTDRSVGHLLWRRLGLVKDLVGSSHWIFPS